MNAPITQTLSARRPLRSAAVEEALFDVEKTMTRLAHGHRVDRAGIMAAQQIATGGKRIRARLALEACASFGVDRATAIKWAAAVELLHNATLIHDDIQDGDTTRRGRPTVWATHGVAQAINAGDLMLMLPFLAVAEMDNERKAELFSIVAETATHIVRGQVEELGLKEAGRLDVESYVSACRGKTGALMALPVVGAAILGGRSASEAQALGEYFIELGVLFQIQDDVVDLFGDKGRGQIGCDIYEGKVSALLVAHIEQSPETERVVMGIIDKPRSETTEDDVEKVKGLYVLSGALDRVMDMMCEIRDDVLGSALLRKEADIRHLAVTLVEMALAPLAGQVSASRRGVAS